MKEALTRLIEPVVESLGIELYDLEYGKEGSDRVLRIFIDKPEGVDLNDCEKVHHAVEAMLDEADPIDTAYTLSISSPGIERKLVKEAHYIRYIGERVAIKLFAPHQAQKGRRNFRGQLKSLQENTVIIDIEGEEISFNLENIASCRLVVFE